MTARPCVPCFGKANPSRRRSHPSLSQKFKPRLTLLSVSPGPRSAALICIHSMAHSVAPRPPWQMGHEAIGTIVKVGRDVTTLKVGDKCIIPSSPDDGHLNIEPLSVTDLEASGLGSQFGNLPGCQGTSHIPPPQSSTSPYHIAPRITGHEPNMSAALSPINLSSQSHLLANPSHTTTFLSTNPPAPLLRQT